MIFFYCIDQLNSELYLPPKLSHNDKAFIIKKTSGMKMYAIQKELTL